MDIKNRVQTIIKNNKSQFLFCLITTFVLGLIAHGYMFLNNSISHDSLNEFISTEATISWKLQLGRIFWPAYQALTRGFITVPWLIGLLSLLYIGIAVFFVVKIFNIQSKPITVLVSGLLTINLTVVSVFATYINDADVDIFAMLLAVVSAFLWKKYKFGYLVGILPLTLAIGLYQSYISVAITLIMFVLILNLLNGAKFKQVFIDGIKAVCMILVAGILYFIAMKLILHFADISIASGNNNSIDTILHMSFIRILRTTIKSYILTITNIAAPFLLSQISVFPFRINAFAIFNIFIIALSAIPVLKYLFNKRVKFLEKFLTLVLLALLPIGMNISKILAGGISHQLMHFALWLTYLFVILLFTNIKKDGTISNDSKKLELLNKLRTALCLGFVALIIVGNVRTANTAYVVKNFDKDATISFFTRVTEKIESCKNYVPGETKVVFIGKPTEAFYDSEEIKEVKGSLPGLGFSNSLGTAKREYYDLYYKYVLKTPISLVSQEEWDSFNGENPLTDEMPIYPQNGCMKMIDGILVVKVGDKIVEN